jgi:hypothetical protein
MAHVVVCMSASSGLSHIHLLATPGSTCMGVNLCATCDSTDGKICHTLGRSWWVAFSTWKRLKAELSYLSGVSELVAKRVMHRCDSMNQRDTRTYVYSLHLETPVERCYPKSSFIEPRFFYDRCKRIHRFQAFAGYLSIGFQHFHCALYYNRVWKQLDAASIQSRAQLSDRIHAILTMNPHQMPYPMKYPLA